MPYWIENSQMPSYYECRQCFERFEFPFYDASYYLGNEVQPVTVTNGSFLDAALAPAWCLDCNRLAKAEDIAILRVYEDALALVLAGHSIRYPVNNYIEPGCPDSPEEREYWVSMLKAYVRWRLRRQNRPRVLCCGGYRYQLMSVAQPLIKHNECEYGFVVPCINLGSGMTRGPSQIRLYSSEGEFMGILRGGNAWEAPWTLEPMAYPAREAD